MQNMAIGTDRTTRFLRRFRIKNRIMIILVLVLMISSIVILLLSRAFSYLLVRNYLYGYVESAQKEIVTSVEFLIDEVNMLSVRLMTNQSIYNLFDESSLSYDDRKHKLREILDSLIVNRDNIGDIIIVTNSNEVYGYDSDVNMIQKPDELYINQIENSAVMVFGSVKKDKDGNYYIPLGMKYRNFYTGQSIGYLIIYIRESVLCDIYKKVVPDWGYSFILSKDRYVISHPEKDLVGSTIFDRSVYNSDKTFDYKNMQYEGKSVILATYRLSDRMKSLGCDWKIVSIINDSVLFEAIHQINQYLLLIGIFMGLLTVAASSYIAFNLAKSLARLKRKLNVFGNGNMEVALFENTGDEIWELEKSFNNMVVKIKELIQKNNEEKEKQRELELIALQAQIKPHFLYNTLDAIGWIAKIKKQDEIEKLTMALAMFFRISLHKGDKFITVDEEIRLVQSFVTIEQIRFPNKFEISYHIPEEMKTYKMLKIILQPLVENAIKHGISKKKGKGNITVNGYIIEDTLKFEVIDDGVGFDINKVNENKASQYNGYGLFNVNERIKLEYGFLCGLTVYSEINKGTRIEVLIKMK
jgi:two-component system sensor histidine kinase YesM